MLYFLSLLFWIFKMDTTAMADESEAIKELLSPKNIATEDYDRVEYIQGDAFKKSNGKLAYREKHSIFYKDEKPVRVKTEYISPTGENYGEFESDYTQHPYIPNYKFLDERFGRLEGLTWVGPKEVEVFGRKKKSSKLKKKNIKIGNKTVFAAQGFNFFFIDNIMKLQRLDEPLEVKFIIPMEGKKYSFRIRKRGESKRGLVKFRIEIDNWFLRLFAPHIDLKYDTMQNRLVEYKGPSNLLNKKKQVQSVIILYKVDPSERP